MLNRVAATATVVLAFSCTGCGGGSSDAEDAPDPTAASSSTQTLETSPTPTTTPFPTAAAESAASAALLSISDFPAGWSTSKDESDDQDATSYQEQMADCLGASPDLIAGEKAAVHEESPDFDSPDGNTTITETISVDDTTRADQVFEVLHQPNLTDCMTDAFDAYMKKLFADSDDPDLKSATLGDTEVGQLSSGHYGDDTVALRATVPFEVQGFSTNVYVDVLYVRRGNAVANLQFQAVSNPVDPQITAQFTRLATRKMAQQDFPNV